MAAAVARSGAPDTPDLGRWQPLAPCLILVLAAATLIADAITARDMSMGEDVPVLVSTANAPATAIVRVATALVLCASALTIVVAVVSRGLPRAGLRVWLGYLAFVASCFVLPAFAGRIPGLDPRLLYPPLAFTALYLAPPLSADRFGTLCKVALGAVVYASLAAAVLAPGQALATNYVGVFPWPDVRLYGVGGGAISLGVQSAAFLLLEVASPSRSRLRWVHLAAGAAALFLCQAKTSWFFALAALAVMLLSRLRRRLAVLRLATGPSARALRILVSACAAAALVAFAADRVAELDIRSLRAGESLSTFTGRTYIWAASAKAWLDDPVFGYGLGLWEGEFRARYGPNIPHAHNQVLQTLGSAGLVGLAGLIVYLAVSLRAALRALPITAAPMVLLGGMLVQCLTNVPYLGYFLVEPLVVVHLLTFAAVVNAEKLARAGAGAAAAPTASPAMPP